MAGYFITLEGPDGAGKTTVLAKIIKKLSNKLNYDFIVTREPGGSQIAEKIREIILDPQNTEMNDKTEALLYAAARSQHVSEIIMPALKQGKIVFSDRFVDSSLAYQGAGRKLGIDKVKAINDFATDNLKPDLTLFLDLPPKVGLARIAAERADKEDRLEQEKIDFHNQVYQGYLMVNKLADHPIEVINANQELDQVVDDSIAAIKTNLPQIFK